MDPRIQSNLGIGLNFQKPLGTTGGVATDGAAFESALKGSEAQLASRSTAPANLLFQTMSNGLMMSPVSTASPVGVTEASPVQSARESLYRQLGVDGIANFGSTEAFLQCRGLEVEGPALSFSHADLVTVS